MEDQTTMDTGENTFLHAVALDDSLQDDLRRRFLFRTFGHATLPL